MTLPVKDQRAEGDVSWARQSRFAGTVERRVVGSLSTSAIPVAPPLFFQTSLTNL